MDHRKTIATLVALGAAVPGAQAQTANSVVAPETVQLYIQYGLENLMDDVLRTCGVPSTVTYTSATWDSIENALRNSAHGFGNQVIAPMVRDLTTSVCLTASALNPQALVLGLNSAAVIRNKGNESGTLCAGVANQGDFMIVTERNGVPDIQPTSLRLPNGGTYAFSASNSIDSGPVGAWSDPLRVLYAGLHHDGSKDCASDVRHSLIRNWTALFEDTCTSNEGCTNGLKHAFRPPDRSTISELFADLIGVGSATTTATWCNGNERQDRDPVRVNCDPADDACQKCTSTASTVCDADPLQRGLGVVLAIQTAETPELDAIRFDNRACAAGLFRLAPADSFSSTICPNGGPKIGTQCWAPVDAAGNFGCLASGNSWPVGSPTATRLSGGTLRVYNRVIRRANGTLPVVPGTTSNWSTWYKSRVKTAATACTELDATDQIACLVSRDPCNVGFAGRWAPLIINPDGTPKYTVDGILVDGIDANTQSIRAVLTRAPNAYPLARPVQLNTLLGFGALPATTPAQNGIAQCLSARAVADGLMERAGFLTIDDAPLAGAAAPVLQGAQVCHAFEPVQPPDGT